MRTCLGWSALGPNMGHASNTFCGAAMASFATDRNCCALTALPGGACRWRPPAVSCQPSGGAVKPMQQHRSCRLICGSGFRPHCVLRELPASSSLGADGGYSATWQSPQQRLPGSHPAQLPHRAWPPSASHRAATSACAGREFAADDPVVLAAGPRLCRWQQIPGPWPGRTHQVHVCGAVTAAALGCCIAAAAPAGGGCRLHARWLPGPGLTAVGAGGHCLPRCPCVP